MCKYCSACNWTFLYSSYTYTLSHNYKSKTIRKIDFNSINEFKDKLSSEPWQNVFENDNNDVDSIFNSFLHTYLQIFLLLFSQNNSQQDIK
jgi:hypothetical protein